MKRTNTILSVAAAAAMMLAVAPSVVRAESAAQSGNAAEFLQGVTCPIPGTSTTNCYDPNASGTKYSASVTVVYDKDGTSCEGAEGSGPKLKNVYFNATVQLNNASWVGTTDFKTANPSVGVICFGSIETATAKTIVDLLRVKALPGVGCNQGACDFRVKSVSNFQTTVAGSDTYSGGFSVDLTIAAKQ